MSANWMDVAPLSFNTMLLLERVQLSWLPGWLPETELAIALSANPAVEWYMRHKCPELNEWLDGVMTRGKPSHVSSAEETRHAEEAILRTINDLVVYVVDPSVYDAQPFLQWDARELTSLIDFAGKTVIDIGSGTGRLALVAANEARVAYAVEPVGNLRRYLKEKARSHGFGNVFAVDGLITDLPFPDGFADVTMGGHVFGDQPEEEYREMVRVTQPGGTVMLFPGNVDRDNDRHHFLVSRGFEWSRFEEPGEGMMRSYWKRVERESIR
jgi:SAM-dependent methyltransferase